jgi:hypothetical protein
LAKIGRVREVNKRFLAELKPEIESWGLSKHPNPRTYFGRSDFGSRYDFADMRDISNIRLATFSILSPEPTFWIRGYKMGPLSTTPEELLALFDNVEGLFALSPRFSLRHLLLPGYRLRPKRGETIADSAARLIQEVAGDLPRLKRYLYG